MASRLPSLRGIETFVCVAELLNLRLASERLNVTVSAISHRIQVLELEVGLQLFDRSGRRLRLTPDGELFLERLRPGISLLQDATQMTRRKVARPMFRISAPPLVNDWLLSRIAGFAALHPDIRIELLTSGRRRSAAANVSIMPLTAANLRDGAKLLSEIRITPICSPGFLAAHPVRTARDLLDLPLLDTIPSPKGWNEWFAAAGVSDELPSPFLAFDNHAQLYHAAVQGLGLALAMRSITAGQVAEGLLVEPIALDCEFRPHLGILVNEAANARLGRAFARWAEEALG